MTSPEFAQVEMLAQVDDLVTQFTHWVERPSAWQSLRSVRLVIQRVLQRVDPLRIRMDAPLVVATFGGTGVGKSSLVNALIGEEVAVAGRQRPTTTQPTVIAHRETNLEAYNFPPDELRFVQRDARLLRDWLIIDCPDPDTSESDEAGTNLARLHRILPFCDVLLYVSTQQKYRSARVSQELLQAAEGCKLLFVQTHADRDADIRADWRRQLEPGFRVAEMFFVDSRQALAEHRSGMRPAGDFGRLLDVLQQELSAVQRVRIRQGNLFGLLHAALGECLSQLRTTEPRVTQLQTALQDQRQALAGTLTRRVESELLSSRGLWERRLLGEVVQEWGLSPFSLVLRAWQGQASLLASWALLRARSSVQVALWGALQGARWVQNWHQEQQQSAQPAPLQLTEAELREAQLVIAGHARSAGLDREVMTQAEQDLSQAAVAAEDQFWQMARQRLDAEILSAARQHAAWPVRLMYEVGFSLLPLWLLFRIGKNFFYDSWWYERPLLESSFYIPALLFLLLWTGLALMLFTARLRRGISRRVRALATELTQVRFTSGLFPRVEASCREFREDIEHLEDLSVLVAGIRDQVSMTPGLSEAVLSAPNSRIAAS